jgi:hypothetical protein
VYIVVTTEYRSLQQDRTRNRIENRRIAFESYILAAICLLDLATTVFWVSYRNASEGNPLMDWYLRSGGTPAFIAVKVVLCALPLFIAEWARRTSPKFVHSMLRLGIVAYIGLYGLGVIHVNRAEAARDAETFQALQIACEGEGPDSIGLLPL